MALAVLRDGRKPLPMRLAVVRTVRIYHGWQPKESHDHVLKCLAAMIAQGELADVAIEDLRRWKMWDLTPRHPGAVRQEGLRRPDHAAGHRALSLSPARTTRRRRSSSPNATQVEPDLVKEVEESLQFEK